MVRSSRSPGHPHDGADDAVVAAAATQIAGERAANLGFGRLRIALEQVGRRNDHAAGAIAALRGLLDDEGLLQWMQLVEGAEPLQQRGDLIRTEVRDRHHAGAHGRAVDEHRAGAALRTAATEFRAIELEIAAQHVEQRRIRLGLDRTGRPIDRQADGHRDCVSSRGKLGCCWRRAAGVLRVLHLKQKQGKYKSCRTW